MATSPAESLDKLLGIDLTDPVQKLACELVEDHASLIRNLIRNGDQPSLNKSLKAWRMGVTVDAVEEFESGAMDPTLSFIRRYALAIGYNIHTRIERNDR